MDDIRSVSDASVRARAEGNQLHNALKPLRETANVLAMAFNGKVAWFAVVNSKTWAAFCRYEQARPRSLPEYLSPSAVGSSLGEDDEANLLLRSSDRRPDYCH